MQAEVQKSFQDLRILHCAIFSFIHEIVYCFFFDLHFNFWLNFLIYFLSTKVLREILIFFGMRVVLTNQMNLISDCLHSEMTEAEYSTWNVLVMTQRCIFEIALPIFDSFISVSALSSIILTNHSYECVCMRVCRPVVLLLIQFD